MLLDLLSLVTGPAPLYGGVGGAWMPYFFIEREPTASYLAILIIRRREEDELLLLI